MSNALILLAQGFEDIEAVTPIDLLRRAKIHVTLAGLDSTIVTGSRGITVETDIVLSEIMESYDACILPGGMPGAKNLADSELVGKLLRKFNAAGKIIGAICASPALILAPLGILHKKNATCFKGMENHFDGSTNYQDKPVVTDGNIITSQGAGTAFDFGLALIEKIKSKDAAEEVALATLYKR